MGLLLFLRLALDEVNDVRMLDIQDRHLGRATRLAAALDDARKRIETTHEAQGSARRSAARHAFVARPQTS